MLRATYPFWVHPTKQASSDSPLTFMHNALGSSRTRKHDVSLLSDSPPKYVSSAHTHVCVVWAGGQPTCLSSPWMCALNVSTLYYCRTLMKTCVTYSCTPCRQGGPEVKELYCFTGANPMPCCSHLPCVCRFRLLLRHSGRRQGQRFLLRRGPQGRLLLPGCRRRCEGHGQGRRGDV